MILSVCVKCGCMCVYVTKCMCKLKEQNIYHVSFFLPISGCHSPELQSGFNGNKGWCILGNLVIWLP